MRFVCDSCRAQYMISDEKVGPKGVKVRCKKCGYVILVKKADANGHSHGSAPSKAPPQQQPHAPVALSNDPDDALATQVMNNPLGNSPAATLPIPGEGVDATNPGINDEKTTQMPAQKSGFDASEDEIGAVFDQVLNSGAHSIPKGAKAADEKTELERPAVGSEGDDRMSTRVLDAEVVKKLAEETGGEGAEGKNGHGEKKDIPKTDWFVAIDDKQTGPLTLDKIKEHWERGEIGPDSLCWRAGFSDWIPVSEVADLAAELAPRPAKPVMVAPMSGGMPGPVVSVPVESAFSAGGMMKSVRSEVQVPLAAAPAEETGSWRPSAASALASLVKEEMEALAKPPPKAPVSDPVGGDVPLVSSGGLLSDLPEASIAQQKPAKGVNGHGTRLGADGAGEMTSAHGPRNPYIANPGATYSSPAVAQYRAPQQTNVALIAIIAFAGVAVLGIGAFVFVSMNNKPVHVDPPPQQPVAQQQPPVQQPQNPQQPNPQQPQNPQQPNPQQPLQPTPNGTVGTPPGQPTPGKPELQAANTNTQAKPTAPKPIGAPSKTTSEGKPVAAKTNDPTEKPPKEEKEKPAKPVAEAKGGDDEFAAAFGGESKPKKGEPKAEKGSSEEGSGTKKSSVYIPPAPGQGGNIPETLGQADVMEVVKANIGAIKKCVDEQKQKEPGSTGKLVMKWTIQTSGKATKVEVQSEEFKTSYIAGCVGGLIKQWQFPKHKTQMAEPVVFPFKF